MLRHQRRLHTVYQAPQVGQLARGGRIARQRQRHPVQRQRVRLAQRIQPSQAGTAVDQVVLGVQFKPQAGRLAFQRGLEMGRLQPQPGTQLLLHGVSAPGGSGLAGRQ